MLYFTKQLGKNTSFSGVRSAAEEQMWLLLQWWAPADILPPCLSGCTAVARWIKGLELMPSLRLFLAHSQGLLKQESTCEVYGVYRVQTSL